MARGRMISKSLSTSEKFAGLVEAVPTLFEFCHSLYPLMMSHTDDYGRLQGDAFTVKMKCYPASPRSLPEFAAGLQAMHDANLIIWYQVGSKRVVQIVDFEQHQQGLHKRTRSLLPGPPGNSPESAGHLDLLPSLPSEGKGTEEKGTEGKKDVSPEPDGSAPSLPVLEFPTNGKGAKSWCLFQPQLDEWQSLYPGLDCLAEARKALAWVKANPKRAKTFAGMPGFLVNWFNRANDRGGRAVEPQARPRGGYQPRSGPIWVCPHVEPCGASSTCARYVLLKRPERPGVAYELDAHGVPREPMKVTA